MAANADISTTAAPAGVCPTADAPANGTIGMYNQPISAAAYWIEDGDHVFRSLEFDIIAGASTFEDAISKFIDHAEDLADSIAELEGKDPTPDEAQAAMTIYRRLVAGYEEADRIDRERQRRLKILRLLRHRPDSHRGFRLSPSPRTSSPAQLV